MSHNNTDDSPKDPRAHVRTMDTKIIHHLELKKAITLGLNHVSLNNTNINNIILIFFADLNYFFFSHVEKMNIVFQKPYYCSQPNLMWMKKNRSKFL